MEIDQTRFPFLRAKGDNFTNIQQTKAVKAKMGVWGLNSCVVIVKISFGKTFVVKKGLKVWK